MDSGLENGKLLSPLPFIRSKDYLPLSGVDLTGSACSIAKDQFTMIYSPTERVLTGILLAVLCRYTERKFSYSPGVRPDFGRN